MFHTLLAGIITTVSLSLGQPATPSAQTVNSPDTVLATHDFSLADRYKVPSVNEVFKKNILLGLAYLDQSVKKKDDINWPNIEKPFNFSFTLKPGQVFAFHDTVLPQFTGKVALTTNAHFDSQEGFVSDGYLVGDGVCHLASFINWVAQDAHLGVLVTKNHDFAVIADVPKHYGVSIYADPTHSVGAHNNLYITNTESRDVTFHFVYQNDELKIFITEQQTVS